MRPDDLLVVSLSGHGGQAEDLNGDEEDKLDETICLWDGQMIDDDVMSILDQLPAGLRVLLITDTCHSQGNFKDFVRAMTFKTAYGRMEPFLMDSEGSQMEFGFMRGGFSGQLIQIAGCREDSYSYGDESGGTLTQTLDANLSSSESLIEWFDRTKAAMPNIQKPEWVEFGDVKDSFRSVKTLR
jgi:hypothetical protein